MDDSVKVIFEGIKNSLGESSSVITDRTIEQTIQEFSVFAPQENAEKFWNEGVVNHLKNTVAGQVRAFASDKRKEWDTIKLQEIESLKKEWNEKNSKSEKNEILPVLEENKQEPSKVELPDDVKKKLDELEKFKVEIENREKEKRQKQLVDDKKLKLSELIKRPEAGMSNQLLRDLIFENIQIDPNEEDASLLLKIQGKYNETCAKYTKDGVNPFMSDTGKASDVKTFIERKREEDNANKSNNIVSKYYSKNKK